MLILVRHGPTVPDPDVPPSEWPLADDEACRALAPLLPDLAVISSDEVKAVQTAAALGRDFSVDSRLREVARPWIGDPEEFRSTIHRYLLGEPVLEWEKQGDAIRRFAAAASGIVVTHGTILTLFLAIRSPMNPVAFWEELRTPDAWQLHEDKLTRFPEMHR